MHIGIDAKVGVDSSKLPAGRGDPSGGTPFAMLDRVRGLGLDGVLFRSILDLSPTLDHGELDEVAVHARRLGLYLEVGVGKVNPFATPETPQIRELGGGDYRLAMLRMIDAAAAAGITELWTAMANFQRHLPGRFAYDRFRTDVDWADQLTATRKFVRSLAPALRAAGAHLNIETHEEVTSFEVVRIVEDVGPDAVGITFDVANVVVRGEDPVEAARRVAPYARMSHVRDAALYFDDAGLTRLLAPCGQGVVRWPELLAILARERPGLTLSIEGIVRSRAEMPIPVYEPEWQRAHPDLTVAEIVELVRLARDFEAAVRAGDRPALAEARAPVRPGEPTEFIEASAAFLRAQLAATTTSTPPEEPAR